MARNKRSSNSGTLFKRSPRGPWIARWVESRTSRPERSTKTTDRALATRILAQWVEEAMLRRSGLVDARAESLSRHESAPIREHLAAFLAYLNTKGTAPDTIDAHERNILRLIESAHVESIDDLSPAVVLAAANTLRTPSPTRPTGLSLKTINHSIGSIRGFSRWLASERRARVDELAGLRGFNADTDRRRIRRDLSADELSRLIAAAARLPVAIVPWPERGGDGVRRIVRRRVRLPDRAWAYRLAGGTGFRAGEIASLTPASFDLDADTPTVTVEAAYSKHRRRDVQPIRRDLAELLAPWLAGKAAGVPVCPMPDGKAAAILRADLRTARAAWIREGATPTERRARRDDSSFLRPVDASGRVADFHSLRTTYISRVVDTGASVKVAMELARHSDPKLTMRTYARVGLRSLGTVLDSMPGEKPGNPRPERNILRATGTTSAAPIGPDNPRLNPRQSGRESLRSASARCDATNPGPIGLSLTQPHVSTGERDVLRSDAIGSKNAEGRTRTADLRVMNPAL